MKRVCLSSSCLWLVLAIGCGTAAPVASSDGTIVKGLVGLGRVAAPAGVQVGSPGGTAGTMSLDATGLGLPGRKVDLGASDDAFLVARRGAEVVWTIEDPLAAGGSDVDLSGAPDWAVLFLSQSRVGVVVVDAATGRAPAGASEGNEGFEAPVVSPDGAWAILAPWFSDWTNCYAQSRPLRVALTSGAGARVVAAASSAADACDASLEVAPRAAAAVAPSGALYAWVYLEADGMRVELFRASDDARLASLMTKEVGTPQGLAFSTTSSHLVVMWADADGNDRTTWLRIDGV